MPLMTEISKSSAITVEALVKAFDHVRAVDDISFTVPRCSVTALLGGNGAGKTTTIGILLGLILPTSGKVQVLGHDMLTDRHAALAKMNFQSPYTDLPKRLTVRENLLVYALLYGVRDVPGQIAKLAEDLSLRDFLNRPTGMLSAGQQTRVGLAKAMINDPELLLLDEPTASLDPDTADWVRTYLEEYQERTGAAILLASHNMREVERMADDVLILKQGKIVDRGTPRDLIDRFGRTNMEEVFLDVARNQGSRAEAAE